ncbi:MAG: hypothetical protein JJE09_08355 [Bacteroidia bacterium]|nr:hypothetical protein [Bacteroidia bacterium]
MELVDIGIYVVYLLTTLAVVGAVVFPLFHIVQNPKGLVKSGVGVVSLALIFIIAYSLSGSEVTVKYTTMGVGEGSSRVIGAGLIMFYIILMLTVVGIIYSEINKALK